MIGDDDNVVFGSSIFDKRRNKNHYFIDDLNCNLNDYKYNNFEEGDLNRESTHLNILLTQQQNHVNDGDLFGALIGRKLHTTSNIFKSNSLFSLSVPTISIDEQPDIVESVIYKENKNGISSNDITNIYQPLSCLNDNQEHKDVIQNKEIFEKRLKKCLLLSLTTKKQFTDIMYHQFSPYILLEKDILLKTLLALRGVSSDIYKICHGTFIDVKFPIIVVPGYSPTSLRRYLSGFRKMYILRLLLECACEAYSYYSTDNSLKALGSALYELSLILDSSVMAIETMLADNSEIVSFISLKTSTEPLQTILWNIICSIAPKDLHNALAEGHFNSFCDVDDSQVTVLEEILQKYLHSNDNWIVSTAVSWDLFEGMYKQLRVRYQVISQISRNNIFSKIDNPTWNADGLTTSFANLLVSSFLLHRTSAPSLLSIEQQLFKLEWDDCLSFTFDLDATSALRLTSSDIWGMYDGVAQYLRNIQLWLQGRLATMKMYANDGESLIQDGNESFSVTDICKESGVKLSLPIQQGEGEAFVANTILQSKRKQSIICKATLSIVDDWIISRYGSNSLMETGASTKEGGATNVDSTSNVKDKKSLTDDCDIPSASIHEEDGISAQSSEDLNFAENERQLEKEEASKAVAFLTPINAIRLVDGDLLDTAKQEMIQSYEESNSILIGKQIRLNWARSRQEHLHGSRNLLRDLYTFEEDEWKLQSLLLSKLSDEKEGEAVLSAGHIEPAYSLHDDERNAEKPSVRVSQQPGGDSSLSLADHHDDASVRESQQPGGMAEYIGSNIICPDASKLLNERNVNTFLSAMMRSLWALGQENQLLNNVGKSKSPNTEDVDISLDLLLSVNSPFSPVVKNTLCLAVKTQSDLIDQAALYSTICGASLLQRIDSFEDTFLLSPQSEFLISLGTVIMESHMEHYPFRPSSNVMSNKKYEYSKYKIENLWNEKAIKVAFTRACTYTNGKNTVGSICNHTSTTKIQKSNDANDVLWRNAPWESLFSKLGIEMMFIDYVAPYPISSIFSKEILHGFSLVMQKLLELVQLSIILKILWSEIRGLRVSKRNPLAKKEQALLEREIFHVYRIIQQTVQSFYDYALDRIRCAQINFKTSIRNGLNKGYGLLHTLMEEYVSNLCSSLFINLTNSESESEATDVSTISIAIDESLEMCRRSLKALMTTLLKMEETGDDYLSELTTFRIEIAELKKCNEVLVREAGELSISTLSGQHQQVDAKMLIKFFNLKGHS